MRTEVMLTTTDNPFDPFTQYEKWHAYDLRVGHHTNALLARIMRSSSELSDADQDVALHAAIDEIVDLNVSGLHRKVTREVED